MKQCEGMVFSDNLAAAYVAAVVELFNKEHPDRYLGRTALQKLLYFARAMGAPLPFSFEIYTYGPYSDGLSFVVEGMLADETLEDTSQDQARYSNYRITEQGRYLLEKYGEHLNPHKGVLREVVRIFGGFEPSTLELIATLHFLVQRLKRQGSGRPQEEEVVRRFLEIKGEKFPRGAVSSWYKALEQSGLIE
jgi:hypothetical protein